jgi:hypothetical protein
MFDDCLDTLDLLVDILCNSDMPPETAQDILLYALTYKPDVFGAAISDL